MEAFVTGLQNGDTAQEDFRRLPESRTIHTFDFGNGAPLRINRFLDIMFSFSRSVTFSDATDEEPEKHVMRAALIEAVTTDSVTIDREGHRDC